MDNPLISIIIPFFNRKDFLYQAIYSVLAQTYTHWQLLLIDDGSTDGANELAKYYASADSRIQYFKRPNNLPKGAPICRNIGIENAKGQYLMFLDSDDLLMPYCLKQRVQATKQFPKYDGWIFQVVKVKSEELIVNSEELKVDREEFKVNSEKLKVNKEELKVNSEEVYNFKNFYNFYNFQVWNSIKTEPIIQFLQIDSPWHTSGGLWRTEVIRQNNIRFDTKLTLWQDVDFHLQVLFKKLKLKILLDHYPPDVIYRIHSQTISQKPYPPHYRKSQIYFFEKWFTILPSPQAKVLHKQFKRFIHSVAKKDFKSILSVLLIKSRVVDLKSRLYLIKSLFNLFFTKTFYKFKSIIKYFWS